MRVGTTTTSFVRRDCHADGMGKTRSHDQPEAWRPRSFLPCIPNSPSPIPCSPSGWAASPLQPRLHRRAPMSLARSTRAVARLAAACSGLLAPGSTAAPSAAVLAPLQQLVSLWAYAPARGFAASATAAEAQPAAAAATVPPQPELPAVYERLPGRVEEKYSVPPKHVFAVVEVGGTQYKVTPNDVIVVEKLADVDVNDTLALRRVLLLGSAAETLIGRPYVPGAEVTAAVEVREWEGCWGCRWLWEGEDS